MQDKINTKKKITYRRCTSWQKALCDGNQHYLNKCFSWIKLLNIFRISTNVQHVHCESIHLSRSIATDDKNPLLPQLNQNNLSKKNNNWHCIENLNNSLVKIIDCKQLNIVVFYVCVCFDNPMWTCTFQLGLIDLDERTHRCGYKSFDDLVLGGKSATLFNFFVWCLKGMSNCNSWAEF